MSTDREPRTETEWEQRQRLAAVFGDVLPENTRDDRDDPDARDTAESADDNTSVTDRTEAWLRAQVPPHHT